MSGGDKVCWESTRGRSARLAGKWGCVTVFGGEDDLSSMYVVHVLALRMGPTRPEWPKGNGYSPPGFTVRFPSSAIFSRTNCICALFNYVKCSRTHNSLRQFFMDASSGSILNVLHVILL